MSVVDVDASLRGDAKARSQTVHFSHTDPTRRQAMLRSAGSSEHAAKAAR